MSFKYKTFLPLALSAALLIGGCGAGQAGAADAGTALLLTTAGSAASRTAAVETASSAEITDDVFADAFSDRDLSGEYDAAEAVTVTLDGTSARADSDAVKVSGSTVTVTAAGTYILSGTLDGSIIVDADKEDKVQLVLDGVTVRSDTFAALYVVQADKVFVTLADGSVNELSNGGSFVPIDDNDVDAAVYAKDDITFNGTGTLRSTSPAGRGIVGKDEVTFTNGVYEITAADTAIRAKDSLCIADGSFTLKAGSDGLHAENGDDDTLGNIYIADGDFRISVSDDGIHANTLLLIDGGTFEITAAEGLEGTCIRINDGTINISATDDGVNAARKSSACTPVVEINGGTLTVVMGAGDTDGVDANGNIIINGGTVDITGQSAFDCDGTAQYNGGTVIVNGQTVNSIPSQMMGGRGGMNGNMGGAMNGSMGGSGNGRMGGNMNGEMNGNMNGEMSRNRIEGMDGGMMGSREGWRR